MDQERITLAEMAVLLGCSYQTCRRYVVYEKRIAHQVRNGKFITVLRADAEKLAAGMTTTVPAKPALASA